MVKKMLICFYKNKPLISHNFLRLTCPDEISVKQFLQGIEKEYFSKLKIVQINFEYDQQEIFKNQKKLYTSNKATVFILDDEKNLDFSIYKKNQSAEMIFHSLVHQEEFVEKANYVKKQIAAGRIYQANLTAPLRAITKFSSEELFFLLQNRFRGAYKALLPLNSADLISFSPELFLQQMNGQLITRPIKGSLAHNQNFSDQLLKNKKEDAELSMIVDLLRNDLNSLSENDSSVVTSHREQLQLGYIQHTYSEISVNSKWPLSFVLDKTLPGGSISGCPKKESLKVIAEVETYKRQAYTGTLGWWKENEFCLNLTIRSFIKKSDELFYHAGCGIVHDSDPLAEWNEFLLKTGSLNVQ
jgi:anthranilate/para-aminobenzoate synthase component I